MENITKLLQQLGMTDGAHFDRILKLYSRLSHSDMATLEFVFGRASSRVANDKETIDDAMKYHPLGD